MAERSKASVLGDGVGSNPTLDNNFIVLLTSKCNNLIYLNGTDEVFYILINENISLLILACHPNI